MRYKKQIKPQLQAYEGAIEVERGQSIRLSAFSWTNNSCSEAIRKEKSPPPSVNEGLQREILNSNPKQPPPNTKPVLRTDQPNLARSYAPQRPATRSEAPLAKKKVHSARKNRRATPMQPTASQHWHSPRKRSPRLGPKRHKGLRPPKSELRSSKQLRDWRVSGGLKWKVKREGAFTLRCAPRAAKGK